MKITRKFEITVTIDTEKANVNSGKFGADYDTDAFPNWQINHLSREAEFIKICVEAVKYEFKYTGMKCKVKEIK